MLGWGYLAWQTEVGNAGPKVLENINELGGVQQIVCLGKVFDGSDKIRKTVLIGLQLGIKGTILHCIVLPI